MLYPAGFVVSVQPLAFPDLFACLSPPLAVLLKVFHLPISEPLTCSLLFFPHGSLYSILYHSQFPCAQISLLAVEGSPYLPLASASFSGHAHCLSGSRLSPFLCIVILCNNSSLFQIHSLGICTTYRPSGREAPRFP